MISTILIPTCTSDLSAVNKCILNILNDSTLPRNGTVEILVILDRVELSSALREEGIDIVYQSSGLPGITFALNLGLAVSKGQFIFRIDDDDEWLEGRYTEQLNLLITGYDVVVGRSIYSTGKAAYIPSSIHDGVKSVTWYDAFWSPALHPAVAYRKDKIIAAGGYAFGFNAQDLELWHRLIFLNRCRWVVTRKAICRIQVSQESASRRKTTFGIPNTLNRLVLFIRMLFLTKNIKFLPPCIWLFIKFARGV